MNQKYIKEKEVLKIDLFIQGKNLKSSNILRKIDPQVIVYLQKSDEDNIFVEQGRTEVNFTKLQFYQYQIIRNQADPKFVKSISVDYIFGQIQQLRFELVDIDNHNENKYDLIGFGTSTLGYLVGQNQIQTFMDIIDVKNSHNQKIGQLILKAEKNIKSQKFFIFQWGVSSINNPNYCSKIENIFLRLFRQGSENSLLLIFESEVKRKQLSEVVFKQCEINIGKLCSQDFKKLVKVEIYNYQSNGNHIELGGFFFNLVDILQNKRTVFIAKNGKNNKIVAEFQLKSYKIIEKPHFIDYISKGMKLKVISGIDFSTQIPHLQGKLAINKIKQNDEKLNYLNALTELCRVLLEYDDEKNIELIGMGGITEDQPDTCSQLFKLDPHNGKAKSLNEIEQIYKLSLQKTKLGDSICFAPIIKFVMQMAKKSIGKNQNYYVLFLLTDGEIDDMEDTKHMIVESAYLPISIIIIGIGNENQDFEYMEILDGDEGLWDSDGNKAHRDLVQFINFSHFSFNSLVLASHLLEELPDQICNYQQFLENRTIQLQTQELNQHFQDLNKEDNLEEADDDLTKRSLLAITPTQINITNNKQEGQQQQFQDFSIIQQNKVSKNQLDDPEEPQKIFIQKENPKSKNQKNNNKNSKNNQQYQQNFVKNQKLQNINDTNFNNSPEKQFIEIDDQYKEQINEDLMKNQKEIIDKTFNHKLKKKTTIPNPEKHINQLQTIKESLSNQQETFHKNSVQKSFDQLDQDQEIQNIQQQQQQPLTNQNEQQPNQNELQIKLNYQIQDEIINNVSSELNYNQIEEWEQQQDQNIVMYKQQEKTKSNYDEIQKNQTKFANKISKQKKKNTRQFSFNQQFETMKETQSNQQQ